MNQKNEGDELSLIVLIGHSPERAAIGWREVWAARNPDPRESETRVSGILRETVGYECVPTVHDDGGWGRVRKGG